MARRVVITGMGMTAAHGIGVEKNWSKIKAGVSGIREIAAFPAMSYRSARGGEVEDFVPAFLENIPGKRLDRASHLLIQTAREAVLDARLQDLLPSIDTFVSLGTTLGGMISGQAFHREVLSTGLEKARRSLVSDYLAHCQVMNLFAELRLRGDYLILSNACASGTNAVGHAYRAVRDGEFGIALCGGYDTMSEFTFAGFNSLMAMTPTVCRPFDRNREGLVLGEGAGILVLEELSGALDRGAAIYGEIAGYGETSDSYHMTSPEPSGRAAGEAIGRALREAGEPPLDYINAHGTGTRFNDTMETNAIINALGERGREIPVSSTKSMIGHLLGGAGAAEAIVTTLAIRHKTIPPTLNFETPDPECGLNVIAESTRAEVGTALSNSFGFGGANAAIIIREYR